MKKFSIFNFQFSILIALFAMMSCAQKEELETAQVAIVRELNSNKYIYERNNLPDPAPAQVKGYYDIIKGAYRYVVNEFEPTGPPNIRPDRVGLDPTRLVRRGSVISFYFDARVYTGRFESSPTFFTNIAERIPTGSNTTIDKSDYWSTDPLVITVGDDPGILKSIQTALIGCWADDGDPTNDESGGPVSDEVWIYLTPDIGFGNRAVRGVPGKSTLVWQITNIEIIE